jgi:hypothetical protein
VTRIVMPKSLLPEFESAKGPTEVRDSSGQTLGWYLPGLTELPNGADVSRESLRRAFADGANMPVSEIWRSLGVDYKDS